MEKDLQTPAGVKYRTKWWNGIMGFCEGALNKFWNGDLFSCHGEKVSIGQSGICSYQNFCLLSGHVTFLENRSKCLFCVLMQVSITVAVVFNRYNAR